MQGKYHATTELQTQPCLLVLVCFGTKSLYSLGCPRALYGDQASLELKESLLPLTPSARIKSIGHHAQLGVLIALFFSSPFFYKEKNPQLFIFLWRESIGLIHFCT